MLSIPYMMPRGCSSSRLLFHLLIWSPPLNISNAPSAVICFSKGKMGINILLPVQAAFLGSCLLPPQMCLSRVGSKQKAAGNCLLALRNLSSHSSQGGSGSLLLPVGCPGWKGIACVCPSLAIPAWEIGLCRARRWVPSDAACQDD